MGKIIPFILKTTDFPKKRIKKKRNKNMNMARQFSDWIDLQQKFAKFLEEQKKTEKKEEKKEHWLAKKYSFGTMLGIVMIVSLPYAYLMIIMLDLLRMKLGMR